MNHVSIDQRLGLRYWVVLIGVSLLFRGFVSFYLLGDMPFVTDGLDYSNEAKGLLERFPPDGSFYWPPGMSFVLAAFYAMFGADTVVGRLLTLVLSLLSIVLATLFAREVLPANNLRAVRLTGWISAFYMPSVLLATQTDSQILAAVCLQAVAYYGLRAFREKSISLFMLAGVGLGLGALARPSMVSVAPVLFLAALVLFWRYRAQEPGSTEIRKLVAGMSVFIFTVAAFMLPVMLHNDRHEAGFTLSTNNERNFFIGNNRYTPDYKTWHYASRPDLSEVEPEVREYFQGLYANPDKRAVLKAEAIDYIQQHPFVTLYRTLSRARAFWGFDYVASVLIQKNYALDKEHLAGLLLLESGGYMLTMMAAIIGVLCWWRSYSTPLLLWVAGLTLAYQLPYMIAFANGGHHFPVIWLLMPFAGMAFSQLLSAGGVRTMVNNRLVWFAVFVFSLLQAEYAFQIARYSSI